MTPHLKLLTGLWIMDTMVDMVDDYDSAPQVADRSMDTMVDMVAYDKQSCSDIEDFPVLLVDDATRKLPEMIIKI